MGKSKRLKTGDLIIFGLGIVLLLASLSFYLNSGTAQGEQSDQRIAVVTRNGSKVAEIDLNATQAPQYIALDDGIDVTIVAENGSIRFVEADCPDKICVKTGTLTQPGDQAICMPSKTIVRILED